MRRGLLFTAAFLALSLGFGFVYRSPRLYEGDPDRYYHLALSRLAVESGHPVLRSVPQVDDLGWGDYFIDKEFLFHIVTNAGYALGGDRGTDMASFACAMLAVLAFYLYAAGRVPIAAAFGITLLTFGSPYLVLRMALLRPHTLAVLTFLLMSIAVLSRRPRLTAFATLLFVLSYHAFYVSLLCMGLLFALSFLAESGERRLWQRVSFYGAFGCLAGVLVNPYFPGNIVLAVIHARIPELMQGELRGASFGDELVPLRSDQHLGLFFGPLLALFVATLFLGLELGRNGRAARSSLVRLLYLLGVGGFFLGVSFQIARAGEYLIPICGLILVWLTERWRDYRRVVSFGLVALALAQAVYTAHICRDKLVDSALVTARVAETFRAIDAIPADARGAKVFNCEWDRTPYIFYRRPDLRFIDILDPSLLYFANPGAYRSRDNLLHGTLPDAHGLIRNAFHADFVFCNDPNASAQLRSDPGFQQIYPPTQKPAQSYIVPSVFRVLAKSGEEFVRKVDMADPASLDGKHLDAAAPPPASAHRRSVDLSRTPYLNLLPLLPVPFAPGETHCAFVSPAKEEMARLRGADFLGVGGGPGLKIWRNGKPFFITRAGFPSDHEIQVLIPLGVPLRFDDRIEVLACSGEGSPFWGTALSFWTRDGIHKACQAKKAKLMPPKADPSIWSFEGLQLLTCLGPIAAPEAARALGKVGLGPDAR